MIKINIIRLVQGQCEFLDEIDSIEYSLYASNYSVNYLLEESELKNGIPITIGVWIKYQPLKYYGQIFDHFDSSLTQRRDFYNNKNQLERKKEKFIFSMMQKSLINSQLILTFCYNDDLKLFQYLIYTDFLISSDTYVQNIEPFEIEDYWYLFYFYSDLTQNITNIGFYNQQQNNWLTLEIRDIPLFTQDIELHVGGGTRIEKYKKKFILFEKFYGTLTTAFTTKDYNLIDNDQGNCQDILQFIYECNEYYVTVGHSNDHLNGDTYLYTMDSNVNSKSFIINGWVKLDQLSLSQQERETIIMRVSINLNYNDDQNIGDRFIYLQYFQNRIPKLNGFKIQTQGYEIPILSPYKTQKSDTIEIYDEVYEKLFLQWHFIQFEKGTSNNYGYPLFTLEFPNYESQVFTWDQNFNYFSQSSFYYNFGGDKFTKNYIKGYLQQFNFQEICGLSSTLQISKCYLNCETCDGPTEKSCLSCLPNSNRNYEDQSQTCPCSDNYYDNFDRQCFSLFDVGMIPSGNYEQISSGKLNQCQSGYILIQNYCFQCPYYEQFQLKLQIKCADCYINFKQFAQTLSCTFDYISYNNQKDFAYQQYNRSLDEIENFKIDFFEQKLIRIETTLLKKPIKCENGQIFQNEECKTIFECNNFEIINNIPLNCLSCNEGFYLKNNQCLQCGKFCKSCNSFGLCNYCLDSQSYYLTIDGVNCNRCQIEYCKYCFQYYYQSDKIYSTLDSDFKTQKLQSKQIYEGCAFCTDDYFFNFQTNLCEAKCSNLQNNIFKQQCLLEYQDCQFGVILIDNSIYCIQSQYSQKSILYQDCNQLINCDYCSNPLILNQIFKCILCQDGYYLEIENGKCQLCPNECITCYQQSIQQQDYWKQQIYGFYSLLFNQDGEHQFELYSINYQQKQQIKCLECSQGYVLYNNTCIKTCDATCKQCIIDQGQSVCIQCGKKHGGYMRSKSDQGTCQDCPNRCSACIDRDPNEIQDYNPYFILTPDNIKLTRKCFEVFEDKENSNSLFVDQQNFFVVQCLDKKNCQNVINYNLDVYCTPFSSEVDLINFKQTFLDSLFRQECFGFYCQSFEDIQVELYSKLSTQKVNMYLNFIQNNSESCVIENNYSINTSVQRQVFSVAEVNLYFVGSQPNTDLAFKGIFHILNFTSVTFQNFQIKFIESEENPESLYQIYLNSKYKFLALNFENCTFKGNNNQAYHTIKLFFQLNQAYVLNIRNVDFVDFQISNSNIFLTTLNKDITNIFSLENMQIKNSIFTNTTFFYLFDNKQKEYFINISSLTLQNSKFFNSSIIWIESNKLQDSSFLISNCSIDNSEFYFSNLFRQFSIIYVEIKDTKILNSQFSESQVFLIAQDLYITNFVLFSINNFNSFFISNYNSQENYNLQFRNFTLNITNISINNLATNNLQPIVYLTKSKKNLIFTLKLNRIKLSNISINSNQQQQQFQSYQQALIYLECDICLISQLNFQRNYGVIEIAIINSVKIEIFQIIVQQSTNLKVLHPTLNCVQQNLLQYFQFLIISSYEVITIDNLIIQNCDSFNYPLIQIQGKDITYGVNDEFIVIKNSYFKNNRIIVQDQSKDAAIIYIHSDQNSKAILQNVTFDGNILNNYLQSLKLYSSPTILINIQQGNVQISDSKFRNNLALNSTNSILYICSFQLVLQNIEFFQNNKIINSSIIDSLLLEKVSISLLEKYFPILSNGGSGQLVVNLLFLYNVSVKSSFSSNGGSFYINTNGQGMIYIGNSSFIETITSLANNLNSKGGCFYIDAVESSLNFTIINTVLNITLSKSSGGTIYIVPSKISNYINIQDVFVQDAFALQNSFLSITYPFVQNLISQILIENVDFKQTSQGFDNFLSQIQTFENFQGSMLFISVNYGNLTMKNITLTDTYFQQFLKFDQGENIVIQNLKIVSNTYYNSPIIVISSRQKDSSYILLQKIIIYNIRTFFKIEAITDNCDKIENKNQVIICPKEQNQQLQTEITDVNTSLINKNQLICNKKLFFQRQLQTIDTLIKIVILGLNQQIIIENSNFQQIQCALCNFGILNIIINSNKGGNIAIKETIFKDNICGINGCLSIITLNTLQNNQRLLNQESISSLFEFIKSKVHPQFTLERCLYQNNTAKLGGALFLNSTSTLIGDSIFINNKADKGGSIYYVSNQMQLQLINTQILNNTAQIAGGLFISKLVLGLPQKLNVQISDNFIDKASSGISENPTQLTISLDGGITLLNKFKIQSQSELLIERIDISPYFILGSKLRKQYLILPSGIPINKYLFYDESLFIHVPYNLTFRVVALNQLNERENQLQDSYCTIKHQIIEISSQIIITNLLASISKLKVDFNITSQDYNLDDLIIYFNPSYSQKYFLRLIIECNMILIPIFDSNQTYTVISYNQNYQLYVDIQTFSCQIGEYLNLETGGCVYCDPQQNLYSLTSDSQSCTYKDNELIDQFTSSSIQLRQFYWRAENNSTKIEYCYHLQENCLGGWRPGDQSCILGHIGALCEQCDLYNIRGQGSYSLSSQYSCGNCNKIVGNSIIITIIFIWVFSSIFLSVNSTVQTIEFKIWNLRLGNARIANQTQKISTAILFKLFTNYLQIIASIESLQITIPNILVNIYSGSGNPLVQMSYSWDCFIIHITSTEINYFRIIWNILISMIFIILFSLFMQIKQTILQAKLNISYIYTVCLYIFTYIHPSIIGMLISQFSYREISNIKWVQGNVSQKYETDVHQQWLLFFIFPFSLVFGMLIPMYLFFQIYYHKTQLDKSFILKKWGYLIIEYKKESCFWDIVKIFQRQIIIIVLSYYEDYIQVKATLVVLILFFYNILQTTFQPYRIKKVNEIEGITMKICSVSIIIGSCIYQAQQQSIVEISWLFYVLITFLNIFLFLYFVFEIVQAYLLQFKSLFHINYLQFLPKFILNNHYFQQSMFKNTQRKQRVEYYFKKIRTFILPRSRLYVAYKKSLLLNQIYTPQVFLFQEIQMNEEKMLTKKKIQTQQNEKTFQPRQVAVKKF